MEKTVMYYIGTIKRIKFYKDEVKYKLDDSITITDFAKGDVVEVEVSGEKVTKIVKNGKTEAKVEEAKTVEAPKDVVKEEVKPVEAESKQASAFPAQTEQVTKTAVNEIPKVEEAKTETTQEQTKSVNVVTKEVAYVSQYGVKFINEDKWTNFSQELQATGLKDKGIARKIIKATIENGVVTAYEVVAEPVKEEKTQESKSQESKPTKNTAQYRNADEMNRRDALEVASNIVVALVNSKELDRTKVKDALKDLTKVAYEALTELN